MTPTITIYKTLKGVTPIKVGRHRIFVSGLYWQVLPNGQNYMHEARKIAKHERDLTGKTLDVVFLRRHVDVVQAAFVLRGGRARKGTVALAAVAADVLGPTFMAAFPLPDGRYALACAVHDAIIPDSDGVFELDEAKQRLQDLWNSLSASLSAGELQVYAPQNVWPDAKPIELIDLLAGAKRSHRLRRRPTLAPKSIMTWVVWGALASSAVIGWVAWEAHEAKVAREAAERRAQALDRLRSQSGLSASELALSHPWTNQPSVQEFAAACTQSIGAIPVTLDGWVLLNAQCNSYSTTASFARTEGRTVLGFYDAVNAWRAGLGIQFSTDGDLGTVSWAMKMNPAGDEPLAPLKQRSQTLMTWWQSRLIPFSIVHTKSSFAKGYTPPTNPSDPRLRSPSWKTLRWSIKSIPRNPTRVLKDFQVDGARLQEIELTFAADGQLNWSLQGELYGE